MELIAPYDTGVFYGAEEIAGEWVASPCFFPLFLFVCGETVSPLFRPLIELIEVDVRKQRGDDAPLRDTSFSFSEQLAFIFRFEGDHATDVDYLDYH